MLPTSPATKTNRFDSTIDALALNGYAIFESFLSTKHVEDLAEIAKSNWISGNMTSAKTGKSGLKDQAIRGDYITWLDEHSEQPAIKAYFEHMHALQRVLNQQLFMNLQELETHLALYPAGSVYQKHLDQFSHGDISKNQHRQLSAVLYLNKQWTDQNGGELRLYLNENEHLDFLPIEGRLVLFLSAKFWHEVLPANRERVSLTGWFRTRSQQLI
ncbi:MAG: 2OG-Fe(II) oxygenase [Methylophilus sp.]